jgi:hypothetical protein
MASQNRTHASDRGKAVVDIPTEPTIGTATAGPESATVEFTASTKGGAATTWTALSNPGSFTGTGSSSPITVDGLTTGTSYTFTVRGNNSTGSGNYSSASNSITALTGTAYVSIATVTTTGTTSTITFNDIPQTYKHLQLRSFARNVFTANPGWDWAVAAFNSDTTYTNYRSHFLYGQGTVAGSSQLQSVNYQATVAAVSRDYYTAGIMGASVTDILDYTDTNKHKTIRGLMGTELNAGNTYSEVDLISSVWMNTSAITSMTLTCPTASFAAGTKFALYGIKG